MGVACTTYSNKKKSMAELNLTLNPALFPSLLEQSGEDSKNYWDPF
jgi:hypothetical protein